MGFSLAMIGRFAILHVTWHGLWRCHSNHLCAVYDYVCHALWFMVYSYIDVLVIFFIWFLVVMVTCMDRYYG